jgi:hypothetical protein
MCPEIGLPMDHEFGRETPIHPTSVSFVGMSRRAHDKRPRTATQAPMAFEDRRKRSPGGWGTRSREQPLCGQPSCRDSDGDRHAWPWWYRDRGASLHFCVVPWGDESQSCGYAASLVEVEVIRSDGCRTEETDSDHVSRGLIETMGHPCRGNSAALGPSRLTPWSGGEYE